MILKDGLQICFDTIERADQLVNQVTTVINYLTSDLKNVGEALANCEAQTGVWNSNHSSAGRRTQKAYPVIFMMDLRKCWRMCLLRSGLIEKTYAEKGPLNWHSTNFQT